MSQRDIVRDQNHGMSTTEATIFECSIDDNKKSKMSVSVSVSIVQKTPVW